MEAVKPLLAQHQLLLTVSDTLECICDRYYVHATATLWDTTSEASLSNSAYARESEDKERNGRQPDHRHRVKAMPESTR